MHLDAFAKPEKLTFLLVRLLFNENVTIKMGALKQLPGLNYVSI